MIGFKLKDEGSVPSIPQRSLERRLGEVGYLMNAAREALASRKYRRARSKFEEVLAINEGTLEAHLGIAKAWEGSDNPTSAIARYKKILREVRPRCIDAIYGVGKNYTKIQKNC